MARVFLLTGPTASGKSSCAVHLCHRFGGIIVNGDSQQLYQGLPILTAQPNAHVQSLVPHALYGVVSPFSSWTCATWREAVIQLKAHHPNTVLWVTGGSGFYMQTLTHGLSPIPETSAKAYATVQAYLHQHGKEALYKRLTTVDPVIAQKLSPQDSQRMLRALAVYESSRVPLSIWQKKPRVSFPHPFTILKILPSIKDLEAKIRLRLHAMVAEGVLEEVLGFHNFLQGRASPLKKALGFEAFKAVGKGILSLTDALETAFLQTRHYAKRQYTWLRNHWKEAPCYVEDGSSPQERKLWKDLEPYIEQSLGK